MKKIFLFLVFGLCCGLFYGCASQHKVNVNGVTAGSNAVLSSSCIILPANSRLAVDLTFREFSAYVADALTKKGYRVLTSAEQAQTGILMEYGVGDPIEKISNSTSIGFSTGWYHGHGRYWDHGWGFGPSFYFPLDNFNSYTTYGNYLNLAAYDIQQYKATGKMTYIWQLTVALRTTSNDLRAMMPVLVAAAMPYIGHNTGHQIVVTVYEDDPYVKELQIIGPAATKAPRTDYTQPQ